MVKIGITGGIGTGKSSIAAEFAMHGVPAYVMDRRIRNMINTNANLQAEIVAYIGIDAFNTDGSYNNRHVAALAFGNPEILTGLNNIVKPYLHADYNTFVEELTRDSADYIVVESAYFFEYKIENMVDFMVGVDAPQQVREGRTMRRDNLTLDEVRLRMSRQMDHDQKMKLCDFIVDNGTNIDFDEVDRLNALFIKINRYGLKTVAHALERGIIR